MNLVHISWLGTGCLLLGCVAPTIAEASVGTDLQIEIDETTGPDGSPVWSVNAVGDRLRDLVQIVTPGGEVIDADPPSAFMPIGLTRDFGSLEEALQFVVGDWKVTRDASPVPGFTPPELVDREFAIGPLSADSINRNRPRVTSPPSGAVVGNAQPLLVAWEYDESLLPAPPASGVEISVEFEDGGVAVSQFLEFTPPTSDLPDFVDSDAFRLQSAIGFAGGEDDNRFLYAARVGSSFLPQPVEFSIASFVDLSSAITQPPLDEPFPGQTFRAASLRYSNFAEPIVVTIVPEPSTFAMSLAVLAAPCFGSRRGVR